MQISDCIQNIPEIRTVPAGKEFLIAGRIIQQLGFDKGYDNKGCGGTGTIHSLMGRCLPQSKQAVTANRVAQFGHTACVWNVSNCFLHCPHIQ
jgi:hypothetical protein